MVPATIRAGKAVGKATHTAHAIQDSYGPGDILDDEDPKDPRFDPKRFIPNFGAIIFEEGITGRGRYDTKNEIFRCIIRCPHCRGRYVQPQDVVRTR